MNQDIQSKLSKLTPSSLSLSINFENSNLTTNKLLTTQLASNLITHSSSLLSSASLENPFLFDGSKKVQETTGVSILKSRTFASANNATKTTLPESTVEEKSNEPKLSEWFNKTVVRPSAVVSENRGFNLDVDEDLHEEVHTVSALNTFRLPAISDGPSRHVKLDLLRLISVSIAGGGLSRHAKITLGNLVESCAVSDPEFILKSALYCRRELEIRTTTNVLVSLACSIKSCRAFVPKYFSLCVSLPSDWLEVVQYYKMINKNEGMPKVLRKCLASKFAEFDDYQLAKHCKHKSRAKRALKNKFKKDGSTEIHNSLGDRLANSSQVQFTMKHVVRYLHISEPVLSVMCLLGKKYPESATDFIRMHLEGNWDQNLAGKRMKFPPANTWETQVSLHGNNQSTWEALITSNRLPHMAMLRNLRNIILSGVDEKVHAIVLKNLTNPVIVINGKQFPFRYFTAFGIIDGLKSHYHFNRHLCNLKLSRGRSKLKSRCKWLKSCKSRSEQVALLGKVVKVKYNLDLLERYKKALNEALEISVRHNLPPISGTTLIICSTTKLSAKDCRIKSAELKTDLNMSSFLLGTMCASVCEVSYTYVTVNDKFETIPFEELSDPSKLAESGKNDGILTKTKQLYENRYICLTVPMETVLDKIYAHRSHIDRIVVFGNNDKTLTDFVENYRNNIGPLKAIWCNLSGQDKWPQDVPIDQWVHFTGYTDQVLRYIGEVKDDSLIERVNKIDEIYGLTKVHRFMVKQKTETQSLPATTQFRLGRSGWLCCRLFISSTFRDMHAERDLICGLLIPALRKKVALPLRIHLNEIDLRWGVPEPATRNIKALRMCLEQAATADVFILIIGSRYGWVPKETLVNALPEPLLSEVLKFYTPGMSMTEMEYHMAKQSAISRVPAHIRKRSHITSAEAIRLRIAVFIRDPKSTDFVPEEYRHDFIDSDPVKNNRLELFKQQIRSDGVLIFNNYPAQFNGLIGDYPVMGNLDELSDHLFNNIKSTLLELYEPPTDDSKQVDANKPMNMLAFLENYVEPVACAISPRQLLNTERSFVALTERGQQVHSLRMLANSNIQSTSKSSRKDVSSVNSRLKYEGLDGAILLITGGAGIGKTTSLAALAMSIARSGWEPLPKDNRNMFDLPDPKQLLIQQSKSSFLKSEIKISQRPKLPYYNILTNFSDGLTMTGLPPRKRLSFVLEKWITLLNAELENLCKSSHLASQLFTNLKSSHFSNREVKDLQDPVLKSNITYFKQLIDFLSNFPSVNFAFLIDGIDQIEPQQLDWLPVILPQNVRFVFTCDPKSPITRTLSVRADTLLLSLTELSTSERSAMVRNLLGRYGKILSETGFRNQLHTLVCKREASIPLYLKLACEELRLYGTYKELDAQLQALPDTINNITEHIIARVELECGSDLTHAALGFLVCSRIPLSTNYLHALLDEWLCKSTTETDEKPNWDRNPWEMLKLSAEKSLNFDELIDVECNIQKYIIQHKFKSASDKKERSHLSTFAFHSLLAGLRPLMAGLGDEIDEDKFEEEEENHELAIRRLKIHQWKLESRALTLRSKEIRKIVENICFNKKTSLSSSSKLGYYKPTYSFSFLKRAKVDTKVECERVTPSIIHRLLAVSVPEWIDKIYHLFCAGELDIVYRLLISPAFIMHKLCSGNGSSLLEDYSRLTTNNPVAETKIYEKTSTGYFKEKLKAMQIFVASNYDYLTRYPSLFAELALNQESDDWIREMGLVCLSYHDKLLPEIAEQTRSFFPINPLNKEDYEPLRLVQPVMIRKPFTAVSGALDVPTAIELDISGTFIAYGTKAGTVTIVDSSTMRELRSFFGHNSAILNLCFLSDNTESIKGSYTDNNKSTLWLVSAAEDSTIYIWNLSSFIQNSPSDQDSAVASRLANLSGKHRRAVTSLSWHSSRRLLATGSLDRSVFLWEIPKNESKFNLLNKPSGDQTFNPPKRIKISNSPISCIAFRQPTCTIDDQLISEHIREVLAVGCWDGKVYIYSLITMRVIKSIRVSSLAVCSLAYSPDGGKMLATFDRSGLLLLWNSDTFMYQGGLIQNCESQNINSTQIDCIRPNGFGHICFTKPNGHYILQSGGGYNLCGRINVWNAHLGYPISPWFLLQKGQKCKQSSIRATAFADTSYGSFVCGFNDGSFEIISYLNQKSIFQSTSKSDFNKDVSAVQALFCRNSCTVEGYPSNYVVVGSASGAVRVYTIVYKPKNAGKIDKKSKLGLLHPEYCNLEVYLLFTWWSHSIAHSENGVGEAGGTLSVSMENYAVVSGGGNAECWVHFLDNKKPPKVLDSVCLHHHSAQVIAVKISEAHLTSADKNRVIAVYDVHKLKRIVQLKYLINNATNDWITSLDWFSTFDAHNELVLLVGSNDHLVRNYNLRQNEYSVQQTIRAHHSSITFLCCNAIYLAVGSRDGFVTIWKCNDKHIFEIVGTMDMKTDCSDLDINQKPGPIVFLAFVSDPDLTFDVDFKDSQSEICHTTDEVDISEGSSMDLVDSDKNSDNSDLNSSDEFQEKSDSEISGEKSNKENNVVLDNLKTQIKLDHSSNTDSRIRLLVVQQLVSTDEGRKSEFTSNSRCRIFTPFQFACRTTLRGHAGFIANDMVAGCLPNSDANQSLISVAGKTALSPEQIGCDIRLWKLPDSEFYAHNYAKSIRHDGPVTSISALKITDDFMICISGSQDGSLIFWSVLNQVPKLQSKISRTKFLQADNIHWNSLGHLYYRAVHPRAPILDICTQILDCLTDNCKHGFIYIACENKLWIMHFAIKNNSSLLNAQISKYFSNLTEQLFSTKNRTGMMLNEFVSQWHTQNIVNLAEIINYDLPYTIQRLCPYRAVPSSLDQCKVFALLSNAEIVLVPWNITPEVSYTECKIITPHKSGIWSTSMLIDNSSLYVTQANQAFLINTDNATNNDQFKLMSVFDNLSEMKEMKIHSVQPFRFGADGQFWKVFIVHSDVNGEPKLLILNEDSITLLKIDVVRSPLKINAICPFDHQIYDGPLRFSLILATSDGFIHELRCEFNDMRVPASASYNRVALYPVGEQIIKLLVLSQNPTIIMLGSQSGEISFRTIL